MKIIIKNLEIEISNEELRALQNQNDDHEKSEGKIENHPEGVEVLKKETEYIKNKRIGF